MGFALDEQIAPLSANADVQYGLEIAEVIVVGPDECLQLRLGDRDLTLWGGRNSGISFSCSHLPE